MASEYRLITIADLFEKIPADRVDQCLHELAGMIKYHKELERALSTLARTPMSIQFEDGLTWSDDGATNIRLDIAEDSVSDAAASGATDKPG